MRINEEFIVAMMKYVKEYNCNVDISIDGDGYMSVSIEPHEKKENVINGERITVPYNPPYNPYPVWCATTNPCVAPAVKTTDITVGDHT